MKRVGAVVSFMLLVCGWVLAADQIRVKIGTLETTATEFRIHAERPNGAAQSTARGTDKRHEHQPLSILKYSDIASAKLYEAAASGEHFKTVVLEVSRAGDAKPYLVITMRDVVITSVQRRSTGDANPKPMEEITFDYGDIKREYAPENRAQPRRDTAPSPTMKTPK